MIELIGASEGNGFTLFLLSNGTVYSSGANDYSQLGLGEISHFYLDKPRKIPTLTNIITVSAGDSHSLALSKEGRVYGWGKNDYFQACEDLPNNAVTSPTLIPSLKNIISVSASLDYSLALDSNSSVWQWGSSEPPFDPIKLPGLSNIVWVGAADIFSLALDNSGRLFKWESPSGFNKRLLFPKQPEPLLFAKKILAVSVGVGHALFQTIDGKLYGFGENYNFCLTESSEVEIYESPVELLPKKPLDIKAFVAGKTFSAILTRNDKVYLWGTTSELNSDLTSETYKSPILLRIKNKMFKQGLFSTYTKFPPLPKETENAWRKILTNTIAL